MYVPIYRPPPGPHVGGRQPYAGKDLSPSIEDVRVDDPPVARRQPPFHSAWWTTYSIPQLRESTPAVYVVADSSFLRAPPMPPVAWWASVPYPTQLRDMAPGIPGQSVDNPPRSRTSVPWSPAPAAWVEPVFDLQRHYLVQPFVVLASDTAPFSRAWQSIIQSWQRGPDLPTLPRNLNPSITAVPEDSPTPQHRGRAPLQVQLTAWFAGVLPDRPAHFGFRSAASPGWSVDDPPRFRPLVFPPVPPASLLVQYPKLAQDGGAPAPPPDQPRAPEQLALRWWVAQAPPPALPRQLAPGIPGQSVDAPVGRPASQQPSPAWYVDQRPIMLPRQLAPGVPGQSVDAPPGIAARQPARAWYDGLYPATQSRLSSPEALSPYVEDQPSIERQTSGWSVAHWFAPYVAPQRARPLSSVLLDVRVDAPPFDSRRLGRLASIVAQSQIPTPDKVYLRYVIQEGPLVTLMTLVCGSLTIGPVVSAAISSVPATLGTAVAEPALDGDPDAEECD